MAFFTVNGTTVVVAEGSATRKYEEIGDRDRTFDGTLRETIRSRVSTWKGKTVPLATNQATTVINALNASTQPQDCSGTMLSSSGGTLTLFTRVLDVGYEIGSTEYRVITWEVEESS